MDEHPYSMNEFTLYDAGDGTLNLNKYQYPYSLTDESGNKWTVSSVPESNSIRVEKQTTMSDNTNNFWKYEEDKTLKEVEQYLASTYHSHYTSEQSKTQTLDLIESIGDAEAFTRSNAIKYLSRFGKKNGKSKMDILKAIHYCVLLYHFSGLHTKNSDNYETF
jgi:hypothetical protein